MKFKQLVLAAFFNFPALKDAHKNKLWKSLLYLLLLSVILAIPIMLQAVKTLDTLQTDVKTIAKKIPDFTIKDNTLTPENNEKGFIYQTNSLIFTFDPDGKRTAKDVSSDISGNQFSIGLMKNEVVVALPTTAGVAEQLYGSNLLKFKYSDETLTGLTGKSIRTSVQSLSLPSWFKLLVLIFAVIPTFIDLLFTMIIASFFANLFAKMSKKAIRYGGSFKTMIYAATLPIVISTIILCINPNFSSETFIWIATLFIYFRIARHFPTTK